MASNLHSDWKREWNKDKLAYYKNHDFQEDYTELEMDSKAEMFQQKCKSVVQEVLRQIWTKSNRNYIQILSLGCGPGSDLLGVLRAVDSVLQTDPQIDWKFNELECHCTGVDAFHWDRSKFEQQVAELYSNGYIGKIMDTSFYCMKMEDFVHDRSEPNGIIADRFDFICMSFADAGRNLELIGTALPQMLTESGRVLVLDNDIPTVRRLAEFGYTCTHSGNKICMYSRGCSQYLSRTQYKPSPSYSVQIHRQQKAVEKLENELDREKKRLEELKRLDQEELRQRRQDQDLAAADSTIELELQKLMEELRIYRRNLVYTKRVH